uniref:Uncharacterized protein n=1 Tax=Tanacetum cinerariifolium TaxID=118510 RepID=A0A6L2J3H4_TANCI|nr:hypothetical protein [Tanacetum cinerariifolium]
MKGKQIAQPEISGLVTIQPLSTGFEYSTTYRANSDPRVSGCVGSPSLNPRKRTHQVVASKIGRRKKRQQGRDSTWMDFGGNTRDLGSFGEEMDKTTALHQILKEVVHTECGDDVASFKRRRSTFIGVTLRKSNQLHQNFEKSSIAMTLKLYDMIELPKSQPKRTYNEDLECEIVMVKMPKCMAWLDDEPIGDLDTMEDKAKNLSPQSTPQVLPSFKVYIPPVTPPKEVEKTIRIPIEVEPLDHMKLEDRGLNTNTHDLFLNSKGFHSVDEPEPQLLLNFHP